MAVASSSSLTLCKGCAYYHHPGLMVLGFGGNGDDGCKWYSQQLLAAADFVAFTRDGGEQAKYLPATEVGGLPFTVYARGLCLC